MHTVTRSTDPKPKEAAPPLEYDQLPDWITVEEVARYLRIGLSCAYEQIRSKKIPSRRFGRLVRVPRSAISATLTNQEAK